MKRFITLGSPIAAHGWRMPRKSARHARVAIGRLMYAAQLMIREAQQQEREALQQGGAS